MTETRRFQLFQDMQQIKRAAALPRQFRDQHHIDLPRLREGHHLLALDTIGLYAGASLLENPDNVVSGPRRKGGEVALLARARLIGRGDPAVDRRRRPN